MILVPASTDLKSTLAGLLATRFKNARRREDKIRIKAPLTEAKAVLSGMGWKQHRDSGYLTYRGHGNQEWPLSIEVLDTGVTQITVEGALIADTAATEAFEGCKFLREIEDGIDESVSYKVRPGYTKEVAALLNKLGFSILSTQADKRVYSHKALGKVTVVRDPETQHWILTYRARPQNSVA